MDDNYPILNVLIVDDESHIRKTLGMCIDGEGHHVTAVASAKEALAAVMSEVFDIIFLDLRLGTSSGLDLIPSFLEQTPSTKIIVITAHASVETAVEAMKRGAKDYLPKPFTPGQVRIVLHKATELRILEGRVDTLRRDLDQSRPEEKLESANAVMQRLYEIARQVAPTDATVLIRGESGTGKGVIARAIHSWSTRSGNPFIVVHTPSLSPELLESELFGHVKGAFTGAVRTNPGRVAHAEGGTLFLDEIGELPPTIQVKLLRFLQDHEYERVGDPQTRRANVRILAATNKDLETAVSEGRFREDLFYRLNIIDILVPPLRERPEDILPLAEQFLVFFTHKYNRSIQGISREAAAHIRQYAWPGNVRELQNAIERAVILSRGDTVELEQLPISRFALLTSEPKIGSMISLAELEEAHVRRVVSNAETLEEAAQILGIDPATLWRRRKQYGI